MRQEGQRRAGGVLSVELSERGTATLQEPVEVRGMLGLLDRNETLDPSPCTLDPGERVWLQNFATTNFLGQCSVAAAGLQGKSCDGDEGCGGSSSCFFTWDNNSSMTTRLELERDDGTTDSFSPGDTVRIKDFKGGQYLGLCGASNHECQSSDESHAYGYPGPHCDEDYCTDFVINTPDDADLKVGHSDEGQVFMLQGVHSGHLLCACGGLHDSAGNCRAEGKVYGCSADQYTGPGSTARDTLWRAVRPECPPVPTTTTTTTWKEPVFMKSKEAFYVKSAQDGGYIASCNMGAITGDCHGDCLCDGIATGGFDLYPEAQVNSTFVKAGVTIEKVSSDNGLNIMHGDVVTLSNLGTSLGVCGDCTSACGTSTTCVAGFFGKANASQQWKVVNSNEDIAGPIAPGAEVIFKSMTNESIVLCACGELDGTANCAAMKKLFGCVPSHTTHSKWMLSEMPPSEAQ